MLISSHIMKIIVNSNLFPGLVSTLIPAPFSIRMIPFKSVACSGTQYTPDNWRTTVYWGNSRVLVLCFFISQSQLQCLSSTNYPLYQLKPFFLIFFGQNDFRIFSRFIIPQSLRFKLLFPLPGLVN